MGRKTNVKKTQEEVVKYYLNDLKGMAQNTASDILEMIEQAKALKDMCFSEGRKGNQVLIDYFVRIGTFLLKCYESLPSEQQTEENKTTIDEAMAILFARK